MTKSVALYCETVRRWYVSLCCFQFGQKEKMHICLVVFCLPDLQKHACQLLWVVSIQEQDGECFCKGLAHGKLCRLRCS